MRTMQTRKLTGWPLRWAVARATKRDCVIRNGEVVELRKTGVKPYTPDLSAEDGSKGSTKHAISVSQRGSEFVATYGGISVTGETKGVATCRCLLLSVFGETIKVPEALQ